MAFVEAMTFGLPCIGTTVRGVPELIQDGRSGLTIRPGDRQGLRAAIDALASNPERRQAMGAIARQRAKAQFDAIANGKQLARIFANCAARTRNA
jgi:glycosyltransferase involved in cell wall biosynthesis